MSTPNDKAVLNAIFNPNLPFDDTQESPNDDKNNNQSDPNIQKSKQLEIEDKSNIELKNEVIKSLDDLLTQHKKGRKDLQSKVQSLKKSITKGDRKKKKEIDLEIEKLEKDFEDKCTVEINNFKKIGENEEKLEIEPLEENTLNTLEQTTNNTKKLSKSKKKKEKLEQEMRERDERIALQEILNQNGPAAIELKTIKQKLKALGLGIKEMLSDGNCMYYAISEQLNKKLNLIKTCDELRFMTCEHMIEHADEFKPYLELDGNGIDEYEKYCHEIRDTLAWGGHLELRALSDIFHVQIIVIQADTSEIIIGENFKPTLILTYHRHLLGSGEHYNSTTTEILDDNE